MLAIVAEQTGYPRICWTWIWISRPTWGSIRSSRRRCSRTIREAYGIERDDALKLRDYPTLNHVVGFVRDASPEAQSGRGPQSARRACSRRPRRPSRRPLPAAPRAAHPAPAAVRRVVDDGRGGRGAGDRGRADGLSEDLLDMDLDLEADLGIDTVKQAEVFAHDPRGVWDRARRRAEAARLPDAESRRRVRPRPSPEAQSGRGPQPPAELSRRPRRPSRRPRRGARARVRARAWPADASMTGVEAAVLAIVAEQTGYPRICWTWIWISRPTWGSIRSSRLRCSRTIREAYGIERDDALKLRDYPTLNHVVGFVRERRPEAATRHRRQTDREPEPKAEAEAGAEPDRSRPPSPARTAAFGARADDAGRRGLPAPRARARAAPAARALRRRPA